MWIEINIEKVGVITWIGFSDQTGVVEVTTLRGSAKFLVSSIDKPSKHIVFIQNK